MSRTRHPNDHPSSHAVRLATAAATGLTVLTAAAFAAIPPAGAAQPAVNLASAGTFGVLASSTITNTGASTIAGDIGLSPGTSITGFPPGIETNGTMHVADAVAQQAETDLTTAYNDAAGRTPFTTVTADLGGQTLDAGVYQATGTQTLSITGTVTLDAQGNPDAVFIFQSGSTLTTASNSTVNLINGAQACNVYWQVGSSATLGTGTTFVGDLLAATSATLNTGASVNGRVLVRNGAVTLDDNAITQGTCTAPVVTTTTSATTTTVPATTTTSTSTSTTSTSPSATTTSAPASTATTTTKAGASSPQAARKAAAAKRRKLATKRAIAAKKRAKHTSPAAVATTTTTTTTTTPVRGATPPGTLVPKGPPQTGFGGAARSDQALPLTVGSLLLAGSVIAATLAWRRRRLAAALRSAEIPRSGRG